MGLWIVVAIVLFVLGSMMALKPSGVDMRLDTLRMTARRLELNPKLVACPDWVAGKDGEFGRGMIGQYGLVIDGIKLPHSRYRVIDGQWRPVSQVNTASKDNSDVSSSSVAPHYGLDKVELELPPAIQPFVKALTTQANSIILYWEDIAYVRPVSNPHYRTASVEPDLQLLKTKLNQWARQLQKSGRS